MDARLARAVYQVLIEECGASDDPQSVEDFLYSHRDGSRVEEYRFGGNLGWGGKFRQHEMHVKCYREDATPERLASIERANTRLAELGRHARAYAQRVRGAGVDRTVHGKTVDGDDIVRYDRAGKWYLESPTAGRRPLSVTEAVKLAIVGTAYLGRPGGGRFDSRVRPRLEGHR